MGGGTRIRVDYITHAGRKSHMTRKSVNIVGRKQREESADDDAFFIGRFQEVAANGWDFGQRWY